MLQGPADPLTGGGVPQLGRVVPAPGEDRLAIRAERHGPTVPECARGGPRGRPVAASHSRAVLSLPPVRIVLPSGLNATEHTAVRMLQGLAEWPAGGGVPQPRRLVTGSR